MCLALSDLRLPMSGKTKIRQKLLLGALMWSMELKIGCKSIWGPHSRSTELISSAPVQKQLIVEFLCL